MHRVVLAIMAKVSPDVLIRAIDSAVHLVDSICLVVAPDDELLTIGPRLERRYGKRCYVFAEKWQGHAKTRGLAIQHASKIAEWALMIDADDVLAPGATLPDLEGADSFDIVVDCRFGEGGRWRWVQAGHLMRTDKVMGWSGSGGLHESLDLVEGARVRRHDGMVYAIDQTVHDPVRAGGRTYLNDANTLEAVILDNPRDARAAYYFAQSLRDAGENLRSYHAFLQRAAMKDGFYEETFWALLWAAKLAPFVGVPESEVIARHEDAHRFLPERAEPLFYLSLVHRGAGRYEQAIALMNEANAKPYPVDARFFIDLGAYSYAALNAAGIET
jgi:hypothetical protein